jgi:Tfp pilus assembly major pilin PilA
MKLGFSAVELLLVAGIISILVATSVPNYMEVKVRTEVVDVKWKMREVKNALFEYKLTYGKFPEHPGYNTPNPLNRLLNHNAFLSQEPIDRFKVGLKEYGGYYSDPFLHFRYLRFEKGYTSLARQIAGSHNMTLNQVVDDSCWLLKSIGPDQTDFADEGLGRRSNNANPLGVVEYDPTNGVFSLGEILEYHID